MKKKSFKYRATTRIEAPLAGRDEHGKPSLLCPFCKPSHALVPGKVAACGTGLQFRAVQTVYRARFIAEMICAKCGQGGGEMVQFGDAFVHVNDCTPGVAVLAEAPRFSRFAGILFHSPAWIKKIVEKRMGQATPIDEVLKDGKRTGKVIGYFFYRK